MFWPSFIGVTNRKVQRWEGRFRSFVRLNLPTLQSAIKIVFQRIYSLKKPFLELFFKLYFVKFLVQEIV